MLINKISKGSEHEILVQEIPMQTGEVAINSLARISLSERKSMNFYLAMRLYLYRVNVDHSNSPNVFYVRDIYHPYFSEKDTYNHEKPNAFDFVYYEQNKNKFVAMILGNARGYGRITQELIEQGVLRAVIELPAKFKSKYKNLYIINSFSKQSSGVLFIESSNIYPILNEDDALFSSFIQAILKFDEANIDDGNSLYGDESVHEYVKRFFPYGYNNVPGLVYRATADEVANMNSMKVGRYVLESRDEDVLFSPLDYSMIYQHILMHREVIGNYIIGNNGVGKSLLLLNLSKKLSKENRRVLLVSFGLSDRFYALRNEPNIEYLGDRQNGKLISLTKRNQGIAQNISDIYLDETTLNFFKVILDEMGFSGDIYCVPESYSSKNSHLHDVSNVITMEFLISQNLNVHDYVIAISHTHNKQIVIFDNLSSGEQQLLLMFSRIISSIRNYDIFMVDEPEISMHIEWQQKIPYLFDKVSKQYSSFFVVATHSPIIINNVNISKNRCYIASKAGLSLIKGNSLRNVESTILDSFDVVTKNNRSIYEICAKTVSDFMMAINANSSVEQQYHLSKKSLNELLEKLGRNNHHSVRNEISLVRKALNAMSELYQSQILDARDVE
jgi:predicted ATPase